MCSPSALPDKSSTVSASSPIEQREEQKTAPQIMGRRVSELHKDQPFLNSASFIASRNIDSSPLKSHRIVTGSSIVRNGTPPSDFHVSEIPKTKNPSEDFIKQHFANLLSREDEKGIQDLKTILDFIDFYFQSHPSACSIMLKATQVRFQGTSPEKFPLAVNVFAAILGKMNSQQIILDRSILGEIAEYDPALKNEIAAAIQKAHALQLIEFHYQHAQTDTSKAVFFSHPWFVATPHFVLSLCKEISINSPANRNLLLLQLALEIIQHPQFYPLSAISLLEVNQCCQRIPAQAGLNEMKMKLLAATSSTIPAAPATASTEARTPPQPAVRATLSQTKLQPFSAIAIAIHEERLPNKEMVEQIAWDLKKLEARFFNRITSSEFAVYKSDDPNTSHAPNIRAYIRHTNILIYFVIAHLLSFIPPKKRAQVCEFYIQLIGASLKIGNFNIAFSLLGALDHASISRLKRTWAYIDRKSLEELGEIRLLFSNSSNFTHYHKHVERWERKKKMDAKHCVIPYFGQFLQQLTFTRECNATYLNNGCLNSEKISLFAKIYATIQGYQTIIFSFQEKLLAEPPTYDLSLLLEKEGVKISDLDKLDEAFNQLHKQSTTLEAPIEQKEEKVSKDTS